QAPREGTPDMARQDPRGRLIAERARLEGILASLREETATVTSDGDTFSDSSSADQHPADMGTETFELEKDLSIQNNIEASLADVDWATKMLDEGTYGLCEACGKRIAKARLEAMPAARYCIRDQQKVERGRRA